MQVKGEERIRAPRPVVYDLLMDPEVLARCIPGCKELRRAGEGAYDAELELGIAAVRGRYSGHIEIRDAHRPEAYTLAVSGQGGPGFVNAELHFSLAEEEGGTRLSYTGEAQAGGTIAGVGQRMLGGVAKLITGQFFSALTREVERRTGREEAGRS
ncbi:MAG: carbon monoxide dehydrogenase subunit G [Clostridia bacterium]|nr:carbon monoxide dehydrogenase subunit G [Clostridia bacterium]MCL6522337.1 carbon monoxide dehydrogenase subunit G [Bacillota bacterium]